MHLSTHHIFVKLLNNKLNVLKLMNVRIHALRADVITLRAHNRTKEITFSIYNTNFSSE